MLKKIIYTAVALAICMGVYYTYNTNNKSLDYEVSVSIIKEDYVVGKSFIINKGETFVDALSNEYDVIIKSGMLYKIDYLEALENSGYFIEIYINCEKAKVGINSISLKDGDRVSFIYKEIGDYSNVCK